MPPRARPLSADDRRQAILDAALPLLMEHGRTTTTREIADAAGVAEGTLFRVFATKDHLVDAALDAVFDPHELLADLDRVDADAPLRDRLVALTTVLQRRFLLIFRLMTSLGVPAPAGRHRGEHPPDWRRQAEQRMVDLLRPDADRFRLPLEQVVRILRLLTFSGSHPHITDHRLLTPEEIVDVVLAGTLRPGEARPC